MRSTPWHRNLDWTLLLVWAVLVSIGLAAIYSATNGPASEYLLLSVQQNFQRQLTWVALAVIGIAIALMLPVRFYQNAAIPVYVFTMLLGLVTAFVGTEINGERSWLYVGPVGLQPSELMKYGTILALAQFFASRRVTSDNLRNAIVAVTIILVPTGIILLQSDTGTALVFLALIPVMLFWSGLPLSTVVLMISPAIAGYLAVVYEPAAIAFAVLFTVAMFFWTRENRFAFLSALFSGGTVAAVSIALHNVLQPHQVARIASFVDPEAYRLTSGFHVIQAKAAIGSGGLTGKGYMQGTQTQMAFVPEQSTDFIFCVVGEEFGFLGSMIVLGLFALLMIRLLSLGDRAKHPFPRLVAAGAVGVFLFHVIVNIGMATGVMPVIGIPLPFVSYGGSALIANTAMLATVLALYMRRNDLSIYAY